MVRNIIRLREDCLGLVGHNSFFSHMNSWDFTALAPFSERELNVLGVESFIGSKRRVLLGELIEVLLLLLSLALDIVLLLLVILRLRFACSSVFGGLRLLVCLLLVFGFSISIAFGFSLLVLGLFFCLVLFRPVHRFRFVLLFIIFRG